MQTSLIIVVMTTHRLSLSHHYLNGIVRDDAAGAANSTTVWLFMSVSHQVLSILGVSTFRQVWHATDVAVADRRDMSHKISRVCIMCSARQKDRQYYGRRPIVRLLLSLYSLDGCQSLSDRRNTFVSLLLYKCIHGFVSIHGYMRRIRPGLHDWLVLVLWYVS